VQGDRLLRLTEQGLYCPAGDFHIDPWQPVDRAVVTHGHADHARWGCRRYLTAEPGLPVLRARLGADAVIDTLAYGEPVTLNAVRLSFHPAGHILGSAQIRLQRGDEVWVVSGDYKTETDATCAAFEPVRCHTFVTESTFGLPIYRWPNQSDVFTDVNTWWRTNRDEGRASLLFGYALGKAQRLIAGVDPSIGPIYTHGAVEKLTAAYRAAGVLLPQTRYAGEMAKGTDWAGALVVAPPSAHGTPWARRFGPASTAFASGWMRIRGTRRRRAVDRGFVLSDHVDWPGLLSAIAATGAERIWVTHGYTAVVVRRLTELGLDAVAVETRFVGERDDAPEEDEEAAP
jgi:putative mRNA 3-end processing factor